jgi:hypothetical protein
MSKYKAEWLASNEVCTESFSAGVLPGGSAKNQADKMRYS